MSDDEEERLCGRMREREICYISDYDDEDNDGDDENEEMQGKLTSWIEIISCGMFSITAYAKK